MEQNPQLPPNDEIDLLELLARIVMFFKKNLVSIIIAFLIGAFVGTGYYLISPKKYESRMLVQSDILTDAYCTQLTDNVGRLIGEGNIDGLSKLFNISTDEAEKIGNFEIKGEEGEDSSSKDKSEVTFVIKVVVMDNALFPKLQEGIIAYLQNNEYVKIRVKQRKEYFITMIKKVDQEIQAIDSLKRQILAGRMHKSSIDLMLVDPSQIYTAIVTLNKEKISMENQLELVQSIQLLEGFIIFDKPTSPKLSLSIAGGGSLGFTFVLIYLGYLSMMKVVNLSEEKVRGK